MDYFLKSISKLIQNWDIELNFCFERKFKSQTLSTFLFIHKNIHTLDEHFSFKLNFFSFHQ